MRRAAGRQARDIWAGLRWDPAADRGGNATLNSESVSQAPSPSPGHTMRQSFPGSLTAIKPSFPSSGFFQALGPCGNTAPDVFAVLHSFSSSLQGWEGDTWDSRAAWAMAEVRMELGRDSDGILQKFRWTCAEVQMDHSRGSKGLLKCFRWTFAEI